MNSGLTLRNASRAAPPKTASLLFLPRDAPEHARLRALLVSVACVGFAEAIVAFFVGWTGISNWLVSQSPALTALGAIATAAAAVVGAVGLVIAGAAAVAALRQVQQQRAIAKEQSSRECLWRFTDEFRNVVNKRTEGTSHWTRALQVLDSSNWKHPMADPRDKDYVGESDGDVVEVLNFFEGVAFMQRRGDMDPKLAWNSFGSNAIRIYGASREFVKAYRSGLIKTAKPNQVAGQEDMTIWAEFVKWADELRKLDQAEVEEANANATKSQGT
jgi:hypothetical protein